MDQKGEILTGILPVLPTPFDENGDVDVQAMRGLVGFALKANVDGIVFPGFASEVSELSGEERQLLLKTIAEETVGRVPIVAGASAATPSEVIAHGSYALSLGLHQIMVQSPVSVGNELGAVLAFFGEVVSALPEIEIILQNAPAPRGADLSPEVITGICNELPQIAHVKEETLPAGPAISHLIENGPKTLKGVIGGGGGRFILDEYARGACAAMPALEIVDLHVQMDQAWRAGSGEKARSLYVRTLPLLALQSIYRMNLTKYVLQCRGILTEISTRAPTPEPDDFALNDINQNLKELGLMLPNTKAGLAR